MGDHPGPPNQGAGGSRTCVYTKRGVCDVHGPGAKETWRPIKKRVTMPGGVVKYETGRKYSWTCDLGPRGRGLLRQRGIASFLGMSTRGGPRSDLRNSSPSHSTTSEGQEASDAEQNKAGIN